MKVYRIQGFYSYNDLSLMSCYLNQDKGDCFLYLRHSNTKIDKICSEWEINNYIVPSFGTVEKVNEYLVRTLYYFKLSSKSYQ